MKNYSRSLFLWVFLALVVMLAFTMVGTDMATRQQNLQFSELITKVEQDQVREITIKGQDISGTLADGSAFTSVGPDESDYLLEVLSDNELRPNFEHEPSGGMLGSAFFIQCIIRFKQTFNFPQETRWVGGWPCQQQYIYIYTHV